MSDPRYGRVNLSLAAILADDVGDPDALPERVPLNGEAVIRPRLAPGGGEVGRGPAGDDEIQVPLPVPCQVFEGVLTHNGQPHVTLLVPTDAWYWEIAFRDFAIDDTPILVETFAFPVVELTNLQLADNGYLGTNIAPFASQAWAAPSLPAATERAAAQMAEILIDVQGAAAAAAGSATAAGEDRVQTGLDRVATAEDREQTGLDRVATGEDRTQTGLDRVAAAGSASDAAGAVTDARAARDAAEGHASSAAGSASAAAGSAAAADGHADRAEAAANEFDLTATSSTLAPGAAATVTVSGDGPAYSLAFGVPKGEKGDKGDEGEISQAQLDAAVASLVDNAPEALNTLSELATALGDDPNFATTVSTQIGERAKTSDVNAALAGKADVGAEDTAKWGQVSGKPTVFPPESHSHTVGDVTATGTPSSTTFLRGDGTWATPPNTTYAVPTQAEAEAGTATTGRAFSAQRVRQAIDAHPRLSAAPATWRWNGTTLPTAASQVHAQARVGDFIVAPNLTTNPGWHQITGV